MFSQLLWLVLVLPFVAACYLGLVQVFSKTTTDNGEKHASIIVLGTQLIVVVLLVIASIEAFINTLPGHIGFGDWLQSGQMHISLSLYLDSLALGLALLFSFLLLLAMRFSINYMHREQGFLRFFIGFLLLTSGMMTILLAGSALLMFVGWEFAGISSYMLIGYSQKRSFSVNNATRAVVTNRIGDAGILFSLFMAYSLYNTSEWQILLGAQSTETLIMGALLSGFLLAALIKSAQIPFSAWITRALEGPTPSSAIFYGSVLVHAGIYLIIRLEPLLVQSPLLMLLLIITGTLTVCYGLISGLVQTDIKSALIFSTLTQVGLMVISCGLGLFEFAAWHMAAHASWRTWQFLLSPMIIHSVSRTARPVPKWLRKRKGLYTAALHRFWLDEIADWMFIRPVKSLSYEIREFDEKIINRLTGLPTERGSLSNPLISTPESTIGRGRGFVGRVMQYVASGLHWFEEHLILSSSSEGVQKLFNVVGSYMQRIETLLAKPRYLILLILGTIAVII